MNLKVDLFGVKIPEPKKKRKKGLGYLGKKELIEQVREIFPNAAVASSRCATSKPNSKVCFIPCCLLRVHHGHSHRHGSLSPDQSPRDSELLAASRDSDTDSPWDAPLGLPVRFKNVTLQPNEQMKTLKAVVGNS